MNIVTFWLIFTSLFPVCYLKNFSKNLVEMPLLQPLKRLMVEWKAQARNQPPKQDLTQHNLFYWFLLVIEKLLESWLVRHFPPIKGFASLRKFYLIDLNE